MVNLFTLIKFACIKSLQQWAVHKWRQERFLKCNLKKKVENFHGQRNVAKRQIWMSPKKLKKTITFRSTEQWFHPLQSWQISRATKIKWQLAPLCFCHVRHFNNEKKRKNGKMQKNKTTIQWFHILPVTSNGFNSAFLSLTCFCLIKTWLTQWI